MTREAQSGGRMALWRFASRTSLTVAGVIVGVGVGILILKLRPQTGMGFDGIADALGALLLGSIGGAITGLVASLFLSVRTTWPIAGLTLLVGAALVLFAARMPQNRPPTPEPIAAFEPTFVVQMHSRIAPGDPGPPAELGERGRFPYRELRVSAIDWTLSSKGWGTPTERSYCSGTLEEEELEQLAAHAKSLHDGVGSAGGVEDCHAPERSPFSLTVDWEGETRGATSFSFVCGEPLELTEFLEVFDSIRARLVGEGTCS